MNDNVVWHASGAGGAVAAGRSEAVAAGLAVLRDGGNAVDGAVATLLALGVADYGMFAIGGEAPMLVYEAARGKVTALSGTGTAPRSDDAIAWYMANGIPDSGGIKAAPVPGALHMFLTALERFGTRSFGAVSAGVFALLAKGGEPWHAQLAATLGRLIDTEAHAQGSREEKVAAARERFYRGDIADTLAAWYEAEGSFLRKADLIAQETHIEEPVSASYRDWTVFKCGPWTQGPTLCQALALLQGCDLKAMGQLSADHIHTVVEALKLAFADRDAYYADPRFADVPIDALLSKRYTDLRRELIDPRRALSVAPPGDPVAMKAVADNAGTQAAWVGGTTVCVVADRWGNVVAATPSCNKPYAVCEELGVAHGDRLRSLNTTPGHPNCIAPGKRPRITLTPTLAVRDGAVVAVSVAGGDQQEQATINCLINHIDFGMMPREAVSAERFGTRHHANSFKPASREIVAPASLDLYLGVGAETEADLAERGHAVRRVAKAVGRPVMLHVDTRRGLIHVAGDPRVGHAADAIP